jgi:adenylate cyclase
VGTVEPGNAVFFEGFRLDRSGLVRLSPDGKGEPILLGSRALDLLRLLAERHGEVVSREAIMRTVWPGLAVEDANLTVQIATLRRVLDRDRARGSLIQTIPGRGYRFVASVSTGIGAMSSTEHGPPLPDKPSVAVLPFVNMSSDSEQEFLADGIAEDVITTMSRYPSLFVIARNSSFTYKGRAVEVRQIGRELGVRYVLEGSLRKSSNRIRVTAQLTEAEAGNQVWAERYDRDFADIFAVQDEITEAVTVAMAPAIAHAELQRAIRRPPESLDAWAAYQRGLWHLEKATSKDCTLAEKFFQHAIALDPNFTGGYCGLSTAYLYSANVYLLRTSREACQLAEPLVRQALALDGANPEAHACLSFVLLRARGDSDGAKAEAEEALGLSPNLAAAHAALGAALVFAGRPRDGAAALQKSIRLDPHHHRSPTRLNQMAISHYLLGEYEAAVDVADRAIRSHPEYPLFYRWRAASLGQLGRSEEARRALDQAIAMSPTSFELYVRNRVPWMRPQDHAHMLEGLRKAGWDEGVTQT